MIELNFYSQDKQDIYLENNVFKGYKNGFFVDVGAHDGLSLNNTLYFEKYNKWTGINIEPINNVFNKLIKNRPDCINLNYAVCNYNGETDFLLNIGNTEMLSGIKESYDDRHLNRLNHENNIYSSNTKIIKINTIKLETIFDKYNIKNINYLSIDVEGGEFEVIKSINFDKIFIDVIGFECNYEDSCIPIVKYLENKNFVVIHKSLDIFMINNNSTFKTPKMNLTNSSNLIIKYYGQKYKKIIKKQIKVLILFVFIYFLFSNIYYE